MNIKRPISNLEKQIIGKIISLYDKKWPLPEDFDACLVEQTDEFGSIFIEKLKEDPSGLKSRLRFDAYYDDVKDYPDSTVNIVLFLFGDSIELQIFRNDGQKLRAPINPDLIYKM